MPSISEFQFQTLEVGSHAIRFQLSMNAVEFNEFINDQNERVFILRVRDWDSYTRIVNLELIPGNGMHKCKLLYNEVLK